MKMSHQDETDLSKHYTIIVETVGSQIKTAFLINPNAAVTGNSKGLCLSLTANILDTIFVLPKADVPKNIKPFIPNVVIVPMLLYHCTTR